MLRKKVFLFVICHLLFVISSAIAEEIPVDIKANILKYISDTDVVEAIGSVEVKLKDVTIYADRLIMLSESQIV
ncbi:MAG: hypothetical protein ABIE84_02630, partial [bacterium]